ncbi:MAG: SDR family NAD(P)-dependent oxidoreductase, partial [Pedosphaera sp.]|nr:SDR family NAD(P)-dependent oxidoreductase [Pedosphaera sp.]
MNTSLKDKWVFITGASAGFGAEGAVHFAREGAHLVIGARRVDRLEAVAAQCQEAGAASVHFHELDVACTANVNACVAWLKELTPQLDVLVNNAGGA